MEEWPKATEAQLSLECSDQALQQLSAEIAGYNKYKHMLGLSDAVINEIDHNPSTFYSTQGKFHSALKKWKSKNLDTKTASYSRLVEIVKTTNDGDARRKIHRACVNAAKNVGCLKYNGGLKSDEPPPLEQLRSHEPAPEIPKPPEEAPDNKVPEIQQFCYIHESTRRHLVWDVKQISELKVHFLNPDILEKEHWKCGHAGPLTVDTILAWATVWNSHAEKYPHIADELATADTAQIRVFFTSNRKVMSWSKVGTAATWETDKNMATMVFNLYGMTKAVQRSIVIHEFGHALGLDHEHQRSDFWDVLQPFTIGTNQMKNGDSGRCISASEAVFNLRETIGSDRTEYDSKSIMHYWFDMNWLLPAYRSLANIKTNTQLTVAQKKVLEGVHAHDCRKGAQLSKNPSILDYTTLNKSYAAMSQAVAGEHVQLPPVLSLSARPAELEAVSFDVLTMDHFTTIFEILKKTNKEWYNIGLGLNVEMDELEKFEDNFPNDNVKCLRKMLTRRIQQGGLTRSLLCESLRRPLVKRSDVADEVQTAKLL
ncbi:uncharacterized protein LOC135337974 isoform X3 [Halichondria panicea]|uniref:uncharacterized protein LOC135337974 isoform X3 n=1 Tax=Halichondria panicea TaxID=6063 RepID=UPI00312B4EE9